jgi:hypothetical protein
MNNASPLTGLTIGIVSAVFGSALALDIKSISTDFRKNGTGFTPWGRRREQSRGPNPVRIVGWGFLIAGLITIIVSLMRVA